MMASGGFLTCGMVEPRGRGDCKKVPSALLYVGFLGKLDGVLGIHFAPESAGSEAPALLKVLVKAPQLLLFKASRSIIFSHPSTNQAALCLVVVDELEIRCIQGGMARD